MFDGEIDRDFGGSGLEAWPGLGVGPATGSGRDMAASDDDLWY